MFANPFYKEQTSPNEHQKQNENDSNQNSSDNNDLLNDLTSQSQNTSVIEESPLTVFLNPFREFDKNAEDERNNGSTEKVEYQIKSTEDINKESLETRKTIDKTETKVALEGFKNPYKNLIFETKKEEVQKQSLDDQHNIPRSTAKFGIIDSENIVEQKVEILKTSKVANGTSNHEIDVSHSQDILDSMIEDYDPSLNQSDIKMMMNNPLGLDRSYRENKSDFRSKLDISQKFEEILQKNQKQEINNSYVNFQGEKLFGFGFPLDIGSENVELRINDFDEHMLSQLTDDTQDLSHLSIPQFKNNLYQKDNSFYLNLTHIEHLNISNIKDKSLCQNQHPSRNLTKNHSNINRSEIDKNDQNRTPNTENILSELEPEIVIDQNKQRNSFNEENRREQDQKVWSKNSQFLQNLTDKTNSFEFRETANFRDNPQMQNQEIFIQRAEALESRKSFLGIDAFPKKIKEAESPSSTNNKNKESKRNAKGQFVEGNSNEYIERSEKENIYQIIESHPVKLSQLDISKISAFEANPDNEEFIGNITANNVNAFLAPIEIRGSAEPEKGYLKGDLEHNLTIEINQDFTHELDKHQKGKNDLIEKNQEKITEVSLINEETQVVDELKIKTSLQTTNLMEKEMTSQPQSLTGNENCQIVFEKQNVENKSFEENNSSKQDLTKQNEESIEKSTTDKDLILKKLNKSSEIVKLNHDKLILSETTKSISYPINQEEIESQQRIKRDDLFQVRPNIQKNFEYSLIENTSKSVWKNPNVQEENIFETETMEGELQFKKRFLNLGDLTIANSITFTKFSETHVNEIIAQNSNNNKLLSRSFSQNCLTNQVQEIIPKASLSFYQTQKFYNPKEEMKHESSEETFGCPKEDHDENQNALNLEKPLLKNNNDHQIEGKDFIENEREGIKEAENSSTFPQTDTTQEPFSNIRKCVKKSTFSEEEFLQNQLNIENKKLTEKTELDMFILEERAIENNNTVNLSEQLNEGNYIQERPKNEDREVESDSIDIELKINQPASQKTGGSPNKTEKKSLNWKTETETEKKFVELSIPLISKKNGRSNPKILYPVSTRKMEKQTEIIYTFVHKNDLEKYGKLQIRNYFGSEKIARKKFFGFKIKKQNFRRALNERKFSPKIFDGVLDISQTFSYNKDRDYQNLIDRNNKALDLSIQNIEKDIRSIGDIIQENSFFESIQAIRENADQLVLKNVEFQDSFRIAVFETIFSSIKKSLEELLKFDIKHKKVLLSLFVHRFISLICEKVYIKNQSLESSQILQSYQNLPQETQHWFDKIFSRFSLPWKNKKCLVSDGNDSISIKNVTSYEFVEIDSDIEFSDENNGETQSSSVKSLRPFKVEKKYLQKITGENETKSHQKMRFYSTAVNIKLSLPPDHARKSTSVAGLYKECQNRNLPEEEWVKFLNTQFEA